MQIYIKLVCSVGLNPIKASANLFNLLNILKNGVGIGDVPEEEGVAGHGGASGAAVLALDDVAEFFNRHFVAAYLDEGADDGAHHIAQETVGTDGEYPLAVILAFPLGVGDTAVVGLDVGVQLGEGGEVDIVQQSGCGLIHQVKIQIGWALPAQGVAERILTGDSEVLVGAAGGVKAGMGLVMDGRDAVDGYVGRQQGIETVDQAVNVLDGLLGVKVRHHQAGIDTGIGTASSCYGRGHPQQRSHRLLDDLLHRGVVGLHLPSVEGGTPVTQSHEIPHS